MPFGIFKLKSPCYVQSFSYSVRNASVDVTSSFQRRRLPPFLDPIFVAATFTPHLTRRGVLLGNRPSSSPDPCPPGTHPQHPMTRPDHLAAERRILLPASDLALPSPSLFPPSKSDVLLMRVKLFIIFTRGYGEKWLLLRLWKEISDMKRTWCNSLEKENVFRAV